MPYKNLILINRISLLFFAVVIADLIFLGGYIKNLLPKTVTELVWYYFIFGLPHIIASYISYFNRDYFLFYKKEIVKGVSISLFLMALFLVFLPKLFMYFFIAYTMYHVAKQQLGLCKKYLINQELYSVWSLSGLLAVITFTLSIGGEVQIIVPHNIFLTLQTIGLISIIIFFSISIHIFNNKEYVLTTSLILFLSALAILIGYPIIGIIMMRFTHDVSAFSIYIKHDANYQNKYSSNYIYNLFKINSSNIIWFLPLLSLVVTFLFRITKYNVTTLVIVAISLTHYYLEGKIWKNNSLHRQVIV